MFKYLLSTIYYACTRACINEINIKYLIYIIYGRRVCFDVIFT